jgi:hypothetical protein
MWFFLGLLLLLPRPLPASDAKKSSSLDRTSIYEAFSRGDSLTWEQLEVVAKDTGMSGSPLHELKIKDRVTRLIERYRLPLEFIGFAGGASSEEEFRLYRGSKSGVGKIEFNSKFWTPNAELYENDAYLTYLLFRAQAYFMYRSHYDPEHCTWIVREESEPLESSFHMLRAALDDSAEEETGQTPPTDRELEFRRTMDPTENKVRTLQKLIEFALQCIAQKAADNWALMTYRQRVGVPTSMILNKVHLRERILASDFGRARYAMTLPERMAFHRVLKTPFRYAEQPSNTAK